MKPLWRRGSELLPNNFRIMRGRGMIADHPQRFVDRLTEGIIDNLSDGFMNDGLSESAAANKAAAAAEKCQGWLKRQTVRLDPFQLDRTTDQYVLRDAAEKVFLQWAVKYALPGFYREKRSSTDKVADFLVLRDMDIEPAEFEFPVRI